MLWGLLLITFSLAVIQEVNARMAVVTGQGLADLIRENFGVRWSLLAMTVLFIANFGVVVGDFAGIAASLELFNVSKYLAVPIMALIIWYMVIRGSYEKTEKLFLLFTFVFFSYIITAFIVKPPWGEVLQAAITPSLRLDKNYILTLIGMIGTTITPYMQFYLQSSVADKELHLQDYKYEKVDVYLGAIWGNLVSFFIIVTTAVTLFKAGVTINSADEAAQALQPLAGDYAEALFGVGLFGASVLASMIIPLSTAYAVCESFGFERGMNKSTKEAPIFYAIITLMIFVAAGLVMMPHLSLVKIMLTTQQLAGILCPVILVFMVRLVNKKQLMGKYVNNKVQNVIMWATVIFIATLSIILFVSPLFKS